MGYIHRYVTFILLLAACALPYGTQAKSNMPLQTTNFPAILHEVMPSVVNVAAQGEPTPFQAEEGPPQPQPPGPPSGQAPASRQVESMGSGVIVNASNGYIITNAHVINDAKNIFVTLSDGRKLNAKVIGTDPLSDVAVLQIHADKLVALPWADSDKLQVGDFVAAIGNPYGLTQTVTSGIVSGLQRSQLGIEDYENFIQTDASINPGNSGGALINQHGQLVGINTAILSPDGGNVGIGFAIPTNMVKSVMTQLVEFGSVHRGVMGVMVQDLSPDLADALQISNITGAIIPLVTPGSPAEKAGLKPYDIIIALNDHPIKKASDIRNTVGLLRFGATLHLKILRDGKMQDVTLITADPKQYQQENVAHNPFLYGTALRNFDEITPIHGHIQGVVILHVQQDSPAWRAGLRRGDVIASANHRPTPSLGLLVEAVKQDKDKLVVNILRGNGAMFFVVR